MNIVSVKQVPGLQDYVLKEDDKTVLKLRYKQESHTARIETEQERRALMIEDEGLLRTRLILKNEYGIRIGSLSYDNFSDTHGAVDIENAKYRFFFQNNSTPELNIYRGSQQSFIYSCRLPGHIIPTKETKTQTASFIIGVSWYLFLKNTIKGLPAFNDAIIL